MAADQVLIVDDNAANLKVARFALEGEGYEVRTATDGEEALEVLREFHPRLILMDIQLPGVDGLELTRRLKADPRTSGTVVVAVTAYAMKGDREKALNAGCDGYITKPLDPILLPGQIAAYLRDSGVLPPLGAPTLANPSAEHHVGGPIGASATELLRAARDPQSTPQAILVVEDNPTTRKMFRVALESAGYEVLDAADARTALEIAVRRPPDLIIQDLILPDMDGLDLVRSLRKQVGDARVPIFCASGFLSRLDEARALKDGFSAVLVKPVDPIYLLSVVRAHLATSPVTPDASGGGKRLLLIDDDPLQLKLAYAWLASAGFSVFTATDGASGLELARRHRPDAIVSDVLMPGMDGFALCMAVRGDEELRHIPLVLASSSYVEEADRVLARRAGASVLVSKTDGVDSIARAVDAALRAPPPPVASEPLKTLREEHTMRALRQLERQLQQNAHLLQRSTLQAAQLAVLAGVAEALAQNRILNGVLGDVLASCLDMAGISKGVLYIAEADGHFALKHQIGFSEVDLPRVRRVFDCEEVFRDMARRGRVVLIPSAAVPPDIAQRLIVDAGATSLLLVPVVWGEKVYGATLLGARTADISGEDALAFARVLGAQMGQAIGLAHAFESLAASEQRYRTFTENANDAICILTPDGVIREANRRLTEILGQGQNQLVGRHLGDFVTPGGGLQNAEGGGGTAAPDIGRAPPDEVRKGDGGTVLMEFSSTSVEVSGERLIFTIGRDVTDRVESQIRQRELEGEQQRTREELLRRELEVAEARAARELAETRAVLVEELQTKNGELERAYGELQTTQAWLVQSAKMASLGQLVAGIAHEINNPLSFAVSHLHTVRRSLGMLGGDVQADGSPPDRQHWERADDRLREMATGLDRIRDLVVKLRTFSRLDEGEQKRISVRESVDSVLTIVRHRFGTQTRVVTTFGAPDLLECYPALLNQALLNLISNSIDAIEEHGTIAITTGADGNAYQIVVADTGHGIPEAIRARIFEPFFTTKPAGEGTGLGLWITDSIVRKHGGTLEFGAAEGGGTVATMRLPMRLQGS